MERFTVRIKDAIQDESLYHEKNLAFLKENADKKFQGTKGNYVFMLDNGWIIYSQDAAIVPVDHSANPPIATDMGKQKQEGSGPLPDNGKNPIVEKTWDEFHNTGLLFLVNSVLHVFGWAIAIARNDQGEAVKIFPARTVFRGFSDNVVTQSHIKLADYIKSNGAEIREDFDRGRPKQEDEEPKAE
jgi:hypothetical protein